MLPLDRTNAPRIEHHILVAAPVLVHLIPLIIRHHLVQLGDNHVGILDQNALHVVQGKEGAALMESIGIAPLEHCQLPALLLQEAGDIVPVVAALHIIVDAVVARLADVAAELGREPATVNVGIEDVAVRHLLLVELAVLAEAVVHGLVEGHAAKLAGLLVPDLDHNLSAVRDELLVDAHGQILVGVDAGVVEGGLAAVPAVGMILPGVAIVGVVPVGIVVVTVLLHVVSSLNSMVSSTCSVCSRQSMQTNATLRYISALSGSFRLPIS